MVGPPQGRICCIMLLMCLVIVDETCQELMRLRMYLRPSLQCQILGACDMLLIESGSMIQKGMHRWCFDDGVINAPKTAAIKQ